MSDNKGEESSNYPREMKGYGEIPPAVSWPNGARPNGARLAVQFVINYEEGGENNVLHGDPASETFLSEIIGAQAYPDRHLSMESLYEYGSRAGFWRLHRLFNEFSFPVTVFGVAMALQRNPEAVEAMLRSDWEIASHGYRWINYQSVPEDIEREHLDKAMAIHAQVTGSRPLGWYTGRDSPNTRRLINEVGGFLYDSDSYADDLPYWCRDFEEPHLIIPYTLDVNDMRFASPQGFNSGDQFLNYLTDTFDTLFEEGKLYPKMMSVGLHCRIAGKPGRTAALRKFLTYISGKPDVWVCRRIDIARHWHKFHSAG
jgi:allantoinase